MFLPRPVACLLTLAFWISPLYVDRSDCYSGFDPLPAFSYVFVVTAFNKLLHMDSHSASASSLHSSTAPCAFNSFFCIEQERQETIRQSQQKTKLKDGPLVFWGPTQNAYFAYREDRIRLDIIHILGLRVTV